jgi:hypothetical protein
MRRILVKHNASMGIHRDFYSTPHGLPSPSKFIKMVVGVSNRSSDQMKLVMLRVWQHTVQIEVVGFSPG